jgi:hypothetical protein
MNLRLHPKHGDNPAMPVCYFCHQETGEVALIGAAYNGEAPRHMIVSKEPCDQCKEHMTLGIVFAVVNAGEKDPCGDIFVLTEDFVRRAVNEPMLSQILARRMAFIDRPTAEVLGLYDEVPA